MISIDLSYCVVNERCIESLIAGHPKLESVNLSHSEGLNLKILKKLKMLKRLEHLNLSSTDTCDKGVSMILREFSNLKELEIREVRQIYDQEIFQKMPWFLNELCIDLSQITPVQAAFKALTEGAKLIKTLDLKIGNINNVNLELLSKFKFLLNLSLEFETGPKVEFNNYSDNNFRDLKLLKSLRRLSLKEKGFHFKYFLLGPKQCHTVLNNLNFDKILGNLWNLTELCLISDPHLKSDLGIGFGQELGNFCRKLLKIRFENFKNIKNELFYELDKLSSLKQIELIRLPDVTELAIEHLVRAIPKISKIEIRDCPGITQEVLPLLYNWSGEQGRKFIINLDYQTVPPSEEWVETKNFGVNITNNLYV